jgi:thioredoxin 1
MTITRIHIRIVGLFSVGALVGCSQPAPKLADRSTAAANVTANELRSLIANSNKPVLVEFGVEVGCFRCDELRPQIEKLAEQYAGRATVCRVNLHMDRQFASQLGVAVCPTYIAFVDGQERFRISYPTSGDLIGDQLAGVLHTPDSHSAQLE